MRPLPELLLNYLDSGRTSSKQGGLPSAIVPTAGDDAWQAFEEKNSVYRLHVESVRTVSNGPLPRSVDLKR